MPKPPGIKIFFALHEMIPQYLNLGRRDSRDNGRAPDVPNAAMAAAAATLGTSAKARHISAKSAAKSAIQVPLGNRRSQGMLIQQAFN